MSQPKFNEPNYSELVDFLVRPFLEFPDSLKVDCEVIPAKTRVWIRLAFEDSDKGRVFGRGGRTIQAIRTVVEMVAQAHTHSVYLEIYGTHEESGKPEDHKPSPKRRLPSEIDLNKI